MSAVKPLFRDRAEAGQILAQQIRTMGFDSNALVLALPRGGVPVGYEIAHALQTGLDVLLVSKLGVPGEEELAMGAIASGGVRVLNQPLLARLGLAPEVIERVTAAREQEIKRREQFYREGRPALPVAGRNIVLVDDGLATGSTMLAAATAVRARQPERIAVAVPVASREACEEVGHQVDDIVCAKSPEPFYAVGVWYEDFSQTSDAEVKALLERAASERFG